MLEEEEPPDGDANTTAGNIGGGGRGCEGAGGPVVGGAPGCMKKEQIPVKMKRFTPHYQ